MFKQRILVVHDDVAARAMLATSLEGAGFEVLLAESAQDAQDIIVAETLDLVLLDRMMSGNAGLAMLRRLKRNEVTAKLPVMMLTAKVDEDNTIVGLDADADGFVVRPFSSMELISRVKAVLSRNGNDELTAPIEFDALVFDPIGYRVSIDGQLINLGPTEYRLLQFFLTHQDRVYSRNQILGHVWRGNVTVDERTVDVHIQRLRKAISVLEHDKYIQTVRGAGYRFSRQIVAS